MDSLLLRVGNQLIALKERVTLNLVDGRDNTGRLDDRLELQISGPTISSSTDSNEVQGSTHLLDVEVRHTHRSHLALGEIDHGCKEDDQSHSVLKFASSEKRTLPRVNEGNAVINFNISVWKVLSLHKREQLVTRLECDRPVDQVELCRENSSQPLVSNLMEERCRRIHTSR